MHFLMFYWIFLLSSLSVIHGDDLSILQDFYQATNGDYWLDNTGWNTTVLENFNGVEVDSNGHVVTIFLTGNNLTGYLPESLGNLTTLTDFEVAKNKLSGKLPILSNLIDIQIFDIHFNNITDEFPAYFYQFKSLVQLDIGYNNFTGILTADVSNWNRLEFLGVANNTFTGPIPAVFPTGLVRLWLSGNQFNGSIPESLETLVNIQILDLSRNNFSGPVPDIFRRYSAVKDILLNNNQLEGTLPTESIMELTSLSVLGIHNNKFSVLPDNIFKHPTLFAFTAQNNAITGDFPADDVNTTNIVYANLSGSAFNQPIPSWAQWTEAESVDITKKSVEITKGIVDITERKEKTRRSGGMDDGKVAVEYFGYSKCPGCVSLENEVQKIPTDVYPLFDLAVNLFGVYSNDYPAHFWSMHGQGEAFGDYATQCAIHLAENRSQWLSFTACVNDLYDFDDVPINTATCAHSAGYDLESFKTCVRRDGVVYLAQSTARQQEVGVIWSPTLFFNGVQGDGGGDANYLVTTICSLYNGTNQLPPSCSG